MATQSLKRVVADYISISRKGLGKNQIDVVLDDDILFNGITWSGTGVSYRRRKVNMQFECTTRFFGGVYIDGNYNGSLPGETRPGIVTPLYLKYHNTAAGDSNLRINNNGEVIIGASSRRFKDNIVYPEILPGQIEWEALNPAEFNYYGEPDNTVMGIIAEDVYDATGIETSIKRDAGEVISDFDDRAMIALMIKELQFLRARVTILEGGP